MCSPVACRHCGKTTWAGCGMHVDEVMSAVPAKQRCTCSSAGSKSQQQQRKRAGASPLAAMFGRR
jgi:hypothetical protein